MGSIKSILFLTYIINVIKIFIAFRVLPIGEFKDYDLVNFYKPAAESFSKVYILNDPNYLHLSALVAPLFPLFLKIFGYGLLAQSVYIILFVLILILIYKITLKLTSKKVAGIAILLLSLEPSLFISSLSLAPELLFSFTLTLALYFGVCKPIKKIELNYLLLGILIGVSVLIRPIALVMVICLIIFWLINYYQTSQTIFLSTSVIASIFALIWSFRNLVVHGFFNVSSISSNNIFWFEGVPALSEAKGISFEEAKSIEGGLKSQIIGNSPSVIEEYNYNSKRGLELVFKYPIGLIQSHFKGVGKVLFGVFKSKFKIIDEKIFGIDNQVIQSTHFVILGFITLLIWVLFLNGVRLFYKLDRLNALLVLLIIIAILLPATGQIAYGRFRAPVVPFICIIAAIGVQSMLNKNHKVIKWKR
jgi:4-amino-4-deoxy-L-arabinose transferase-like glycosyltransferase